MAESHNFATHEEAFEFACEHLDCSLKDGKPVLAIVLAVQGRVCTVKVANREDKTVPIGTLNELLSRPDLMHVCFSAMLDSKLPDVAPGDLVLYTAMPELAAAGKPLVAGTIVARAWPHYTPKSGWQTKPAEPKSAPPPDSPADTPDA